MAKIFLMVNGGNIIHPISIVLKTHLISMLLRFFNSFRQTLNTFFIDLQTGRLKVIGNIAIGRATSNRSCFGIPSQHYIIYMSLKCDTNFLTLNEFETRSCYSHIQEKNNFKLYHSRNWELRLHFFHVICFLEITEHKHFHVNSSIFQYFLG